MSMSVSGPGISLSDVLTRIIPGAVLVGPAIIAFSVAEPQYFQNPVIVAGGSLTLAFLSGEFIESLRSRLLPVPWPLRSALQRITEGDRQFRGGFQEKLERWDSRLEDWLFEVGIGKYLLREHSEEWIRLEERLNLDFKESLESDLGVELEVATCADIYDLMVHELEPEFSRNTERKRNLYIFNNNLKIVAVLSAVFYTILFYKEGQEAIYAVAAVASLLFLSYSVAVIFLFDSAAEEYSAHLLKQYHLRFYSD